jgi:uncharacterized protein YdeI (YjbR/CyaY-like superfamily)
MATTRKKASGTRPARAARTALEPRRVRYFRTQARWRAWLERNHAREVQLWVGFWRVATGKPCITWPQSVDEALCFGWIDGLRRGLDTESYAIRFSPRKATSLWSRGNLKRFMELEAAGLVRAAGRAARAKWDDTRSSGYSHDTPKSKLDAPRLLALRARHKAWRFWEAQSPSYRKVAGHWVVSAKREDTRANRFAILVASCEAGKPIPPVAKWVKVKQPGR